MFSSRYPRASRRTGNRHAPGCAHATELSRLRPESLPSRRQRDIHAKVRSTTQRRHGTVKPPVPLGLRTIPGASGTPIPASLAQPLPAVAAVGPHPPHLRRLPRHAGNDVRCAVPVLDVRRVHLDRDRGSPDAGRDVPPAAPGLPARVVSGRPGRLHRPDRLAAGPGGGRLGRAPRQITGQDREARPACARRRRCRARDGNGPGSS